MEPHAIRVDLGNDPDGFGVLWSVEIALSDRRVMVGDPTLADPVDPSYPMPEHGLPQRADATVYWVEGDSNAFRLLDHVEAPAAPAVLACERWLAQSDPHARTVFSLVEQHCPFFKETLPEGHVFGRVVAATRTGWVFAYRIRTEQWVVLILEAKGLPTKPCGRCFGCGQAARPN